MGLRRVSVTPVAMSAAKAEAVEGCAAAHHGMAAEVARASASSSPVARQSISRVHKSDAHNALSIAEAAQRPNTYSCPSNDRAARSRRITDTHAESLPPRSELACIRISYHAPNARSNAESCWGSLMRFWPFQKNSGRESLRTRPRATQQRRTATIWRLGGFPSTLSCSGNALYRGFLTLATTLSDCMKLAPRILKECTFKRHAVSLKQTPSP